MLNSRFISSISSIVFSGKLRLGGPENTTPSTLFNSAYTSSAVISPALNLANKSPLKSVYSSNVMDHLLPPYEENGECSYTINIAGNENFGGGFPRKYVEKQVDEYLDTIRDFIIEGLISKGNIK